MKETMKFKSVLTQKGKQVFKGGNIEVMQKGLITFEAKNKLAANRYFTLFITETLGSSGLDFFKIEVVK